jgi:hypothetical protein
MIKAGTIASQADELIAFENTYSHKLFYDQPPPE